MVLMVVLRYTNNKQNNLYCLYGLISHNKAKLTTDFQGSFQLQEDGLAQEDFTGLQAEATNLTFCQLHVLPWPGSFHWAKTKNQLKTQRETAGERVNEQRDGTGSKRDPGR